MCRQYHRTRRGQSVVEISLLIALVVVVAVVGLSATGTSASTVLCRVASAFGGGSCGTLFADDFANLSAWTKISGAWSSVNGELIGGPNEGRLFAPIGANDYTVDIDTARLTQGNGYGVFFRAQNFDTVNGYSFQYDPGLAGFAIRKWVNGNEISTPIAFAKAPPGYTWYNVNRKLQLTVSGSTFTAAVDGQTVLTTTDSTYAAGGIGLRTWDSTSAAFDNLAVRTIR